jgi:hypothetical protein
MNAAAAQAWEGVAELEGMRIFKAGKAPGTAVKTVVLTVRVENPGDDMLNAMAAQIGGTVACRIGPDE